MHPNVLNQTPFTGDPVEIANQQNTQKYFGINRRTTRVAVARLQSLAHKREIDVPINKPQQVIFGNVIFCRCSRLCQRVNFKEEAD